MKLYDKIMVPVDEKEMSSHFIAGGMWKCETDSIVCSLDDLRIMWAMAKSGPDFPGVFELFLKSKGIQL